MSNLETELFELKRELDSSIRRSERLKGILQELITRLHDEFGVDSVKEGTALLRKKKKEQEKLEQVLTEKLEELKQKVMELRQ